MLPSTRVPLPVRPFGQTKRKDNWWVYPLLTFIGLSTFVIYSTWAAFQGKDYTSGPYLVAVLLASVVRRPGPLWFGAKAVVVASLARVLPRPAYPLVPAGFRFTCYYYRGAYYKAFWMDPPTCTVGEPRKGYRGEAKLPLILQNAHRYFMYIACMFLVMLSYDAIMGFWFKDPRARAHLASAWGHSCSSST